MAKKTSARITKPESPIEEVVAVEPEKAAPAVAAIKRTTLASLESSVNEELAVTRTQIEKLDRELLMIQGHVSTLEKDLTARVDAIRTTDEATAHRVEASLQQVRIDLAALQSNQSDLATRLDHVATTTSSAIQQLGDDSKSRTDHVATTTSSAIQQLGDDYKSRLDGMDSKLSQLPSAENLTNSLATMEQIRATMASIQTHQNSLDANIGNITANYSSAIQLQGKESKKRQDALQADVDQLRGEVQAQLVSARQQTASSVIREVTQVYWWRLILIAVVLLLLAFLAGAVAAYAIIHNGSPQAYNSMLNATRAATATMLMAGVMLLPTWTGTPSRTTEPSKTSMPAALPTVTATATAIQASATPTLTRTPTVLPRQTTPSSTPTVSGPPSETPIMGKG